MVWHRSVSVNWNRVNCTFETCKRHSERNDVNE